jgi:HD-like signal output (HDOD) protein
LNRVISLDPVLTGQVLRLINSAYYALPQPITSLTRAIIMLGLNTVKNLAVRLVILQSMSRNRGIGTICMNEFWAHCLCVAVTSKCISTLQGASFSEREYFFIAGLLHDLGKIPLGNYFADRYNEALNIARRDQRPLVHAEADVLGIDHAVVGGMIAEKWQLGGTLNQSLACHHNLDAASPANQPAVAVVALSNCFAKLLKIGFSGDCVENFPMITGLLDRTGVNWSILYDLRENVLTEIEKAKIFLEISWKS